MALLGLLHNKPSHFLNFRRTAMMSKQKTSHVYGSRSWLFVCLGLVALIAILSWYMGHHSYQSSDFYLRAQYIGNSMSYCPACYELVKTYLKPYKGPVPPAIQSKVRVFTSEYSRHSLCLLLPSHSPPFSFASSPHTRTHAHYLGRYISP